MKKIDIIVPNFDDFGAPRVAINVANGLMEHYDINFVVFQNKGPFRFYLNPKIKVVCLDNNILNIPKIRIINRMFAYWKFSKKNKTDIAISFSPVTNFIILFSKLLNKKLKTIIQEHVYVSLFLKDRESVSYVYDLLFKSVFLKFYNLSDIFLVVAEEIKRDLVTNFGMRENFFRVVKNPLDIQEVLRMSEDVIDDFYFDNNKKYLISVGRLAAQKNFKRLIDIFDSAKKHIDNLELIIIGKGNLEKELKDYANKKQLTGSIHFLGFKKNPYKYIKRADCFCLTSDWEGFALVNAEAMLCGTVVVTNNCPAGPAEMIENHVNGIIVDYCNNDLFVKEVIGILNNDNHKKKLEKNAYEFALREFTIEKCIIKYKEILNSMDV
ncbi:MAG: glycosyltransferase [Candidatus Taylorbacteria bacterium]|nr:glycosyltransferase [Candidatus Taylorbacteria bacterium]